MRFSFPAVLLVLLTPVVSPAVTVVSFTFSGTWAASLGPIQAGDAFSGAATWDSSSAANTPLQSFSITMPAADGLTIAAIPSAQVLSAQASYFSGAFGYLQINLTSTADNKNYSFFIGPQSASGSTSNFTATTYPVGYSSAGPVAPGGAFLASVTPASGVAGQVLNNVAITGQNTNFVQGTTVASFGGGITVSNLTVNSPTAATANLTIAANAKLATRNVTMTTGAEVAARSAGFAVGAAGPAPGSVSPGGGNTVSQTFTFTFTDSSGYQSLQSVDILINNFLDGRHACYVAFVPSGTNAGSVFLVDDTGDAGGPYSGLVLPGSGTAQNSQCSINGTGSSVSGSGNNLTLTLNIAFTATFAGNKVVYMSAADAAVGSSGWQALGTWAVPGSTPTGPAVSGVNPGSLSTFQQAFTFTFTDTNGFADLSVVNVLINNFIDGRHACFLAFVPSATGGSVDLVDDAGDSAGPYSGTVLPGTATVQNSQCSILGTYSSVTTNGNTLTLTLLIKFATGFAGPKVIYAAARSNTQNSDWQSVGSVTVP